MYKIVRIGMVSTLALSIAAVDITYSNASAANLFDNLSDGLKKAGGDIDKSMKKLSKDDSFRNAAGVVVGLGAGMVIGGVLGGDNIPAAMGLAIGTLLITTSPQFQRDMARAYGNDWAWSGCVNCGVRRVVRVPGRSVTSEEERRVNDIVLADIKDLQRALKALSLYTIGIDGDYGPGTKKGVKLFQADIGADRTGTLSAEQRALLFARAAKSGFVRDGYEAHYEVASFSVDQSFDASSDIQTPIAPQIKEFKLAASQFNKFNSDYLVFGELSSITEAQMRPDGLIDVFVADEQRRVTFGIDEIRLSTHAISDQWVKISIGEEGTPDHVVLNTVDSFSSALEASSWIDSARNRIVVLAKLSERAVPEQFKRPVLVANEPDIAPPLEEKGMIPITPEVEKFALNEDSEERGVIFLADQEAPDAKAIESASASVLQPASVEEGAAKIEVVATKATNELPSACNNTVFVSLNFPTGETPITHYNISPPDGTLMMDNGDSTAYFSGNCIQGEYKYKYVYLEQKDDSTFDHHVREGIFRLSSEGEQCDVDLFNPEGSADVTCA